MAVVVAPSTAVAPAAVPPVCIGGATPDCVPGGAVRKNAARARATPSSGACSSALIWRLHVGQPVVAGHVRRPHGTGVTGHAATTQSREGTRAQGLGMTDPTRGRRAPRAETTEGGRQPPCPTRDAHAAGPRPSSTSPQRKSAARPVHAGGPAPRRTRCTALASAVPLVRVTDHVSPRDLLADSRRWHAPSLRQRSGQPTGRTSSRHGRPRGKYTHDLLGDRSSDTSASLRLSPTMPMARSAQLADDEVHFTVPSAKAGASSSGAHPPH